MTSLGLQHRLIQTRMTPAGAVRASLLAAIWSGRSGGLRWPDGAFLIWTVGAGPGAGHRSKGWVQVESFAGGVPGRWGRLPRRR